MNRKVGRNLDIVATNWGQTTKFESHRELPLRIYHKDFAQSGTEDMAVDSRRGRCIPKSSVILDCGGKRSATPLWCESRRRFSMKPMLLGPPSCGRVPRGFRRVVAGAASCPALARSLLGSPVHRLPLAAADSRLRAAAIRLCWPKGGFGLRAKSDHGNLVPDREVQTGTNGRGGLDQVERRSEPTKN